MKHKGWLGLELASSLVIGVGPVHMVVILVPEQRPIQVWGWAHTATGSVSPQQQGLGPAHVVALVERFWWWGWGG